MMMKATTLTALLAALALLTACETMAGLGRDTQKLGNDITGAANKNE
jgi:predicted small secreted protein